MRLIHKPTMKLLATRILSLFLSTYLCEASFSALNNIKLKRRSKLTDEHLRCALICADFNMEHDYKFCSINRATMPPITLIRIFLILI